MTCVKALCISPSRPGSGFKFGIVRALALTVFLPPFPHRFALAAAPCPHQALIRRPHVEAKFDSWGAMSPFAICSQLQHRTLLREQNPQLLRPIPLYASTLARANVGISQSFGALRVAKACSPSTGIRRLDRTTHQPGSSDCDTECMTRRGRVSPKHLLRLGAPIPDAASSRSWQDRLKGVADRTAGGGFLRVCLPRRRGRREQCPGDTERIEDAGESTGVIAFASRLFAFSLYYDSPLVF
jgi:hypothetical protein